MIITAAYEAVLHRVQVEFSILAQEFQSPAPEEDETQNSQEATDK